MTFECKYTVRKSGGKICVHQVNSLKQNDYRLPSDIFSQKFRHLGYSNKTKFCAFEHANTLITTRYEHLRPMLRIGDHRGQGHQFGHHIMAW